MDFEDTVRMIFDRKKQIKALEEEVENLYSTLPQSQKVGVYNAGDYLMKVTDNYRFDPATAVKNLPPTKVKLISVSKPDSAQAKKVLSGREYALCQKRYGVKRDVVPVTDEV